VSSPLAGPPALSRAAVDRAAHRRSDLGWLEHAWSGAQVLVLGPDARVQVVSGTGGQVRLVLLDAAVAPPGPRHFLGELAGTAYFAVTAPLPAVEGARSAGLREIGAALDDRDAGLLVESIALANWHVTHVRCPRCGAPTVQARGGWTRTCSVDGSEHFPRTDPAVIMLVHDGAGRCLLGRQPSWPPGRYSTLAGFVEPGESAEMAVAREVAEEVGVEVRDVRYVASQPWPFPGSLMLGYTALADSDLPLTLDGLELADARWLSREELRSGAVLLPPPVSIAHRLITNWLHGRD